ncbi:NIP100 Dynactin complex subunit [Pyrenophora tritici-repentis]|uniref:CAP-Gly domain containing protein n=1 Tax=Pyrenophora tritici-repentis TaxID=45151 RepID=A0A2W1ENG5_9PLEO|nr:NIP100 Dynactin complex protein [Pyrenophora tritici-repentis]KAI0588284.1 NIP100 Dynactin complex subunit [Pyrenophora tritici-repentis]KAI0592490.1 NIP100 Dynactin complex subunit [Pyrenophora tritici-repentis]KAI0615527.1 NIP100 Dynactin complex subunit [Pyrenophora tritici-repentis]KAI0627583.1 NIP100 Dynactin complex subunit [Pyrenophora tritici-repentis]
MALQSAADVPLLITSPNSSSERRISPSWSIAQLKARLEPITGVPASCQQLSLRVGSQDAVAISAVDEEQTRLAAFPLQPYAEMTVVDTRPSAARTDFTDLSSVTKYEMPAAEYEHRSDSVLAWKKAQKLGRFDPDAPSIEQQKIRASEREVEERGLALHGRVRLLPETDARRGTISYIGLVPEIPGIGVWIGVTLDEPTGKNDGSIKGKRYFECGKNCGAFVRPERCEAGDFPPLDMGDEDLEEL